ncbi:MAG: DAK2 domain-containing protein [Ruminococcaceae bacterium]|nr:DAK2 domain-containing protein [Oscillospiraceae bacterium]
MSRQTIDGKIYVQMLFGGAEKLAENASEINDLNVFPVADGDTGTNMSSTIEGGLAHAEAEQSESIAKVSEAFARGILLSARGNSGVILSQIFAGINEGLTGCDEVGATQLAKAYRQGVVKAYAAVQNPTEGTILTVFRESAGYAAARVREDSSVEDFFKAHIEEARRSLERTKELLPVLAEADVVDSGAAGYLAIAEGMYKTLTGELPATQRKHNESKESKTVNIDLFTRDSVLEFGYCTEFLLRLTTAKCNPDTFEIAALISALEGIGGESIVAYKQGDIVKIHVHTFTPGDALAIAQQYGEFLTVKIENMSLGHSETPAPKKKKNKKFSVLAVASGDGICSLFKDMGADYIVAGGQTSNPSIEEFIKGFRYCNSENIIVLPNNKNVFLAAKQAAELYKDASVYVIETKNLMQGFGALSVITPGITDMKSLVESATRAAAGVTCCEITAAVRDAVIDGLDIKTGDYIAITDGEISVSATSAEEAVKAALEAADTDLSEIITLFTGKNVSAENRAALTEEIEELYPDCELSVYEGGQEVYDYMIAIE